MITALAESARAGQWRLVSLADLRLAACRHAAINHRHAVLAALLARQPVAYRVSGGRLVAEAVWA